MRFLLAGGANTLLGLVLFRAFHALLQGRPYAAATAQALSYAIGVALSYAVNRGWTFRSTGRHGRALPRFLVAHLGALLTSAALIQLAVSTVGLPPIAAWFLATAVTTVLNFVAQRFWVFAEP